MNFAALVRARLTALGLGQKDLARAAQVTDSYISQLLTRKKPPPGRDRTDIYDKMEAFLALGKGELGRLADIDRAEEIKRKLGQRPEPLFREFRNLALRKCVPEKLEAVRAIFERQPFGTLERLVTQKVLDLVQGVARQELDGEHWIRLAAHIGRRSHEELRVVVLEFLDTDVFHVSNDNCILFLDPLLESWDVDLDTLRLDIVLNRDLVADPLRAFEFVETNTTRKAHDEPGLAEFLADRHLSGDATEAEVACLRRQALGGRRPNKLYYYRALQNLRDPLHFHAE